MNSRYRPDVTGKRRLKRTSDRAINIFTAERWAERLTQMLPQVVQAVQPPKLQLIQAQPLQMQLQEIPLTLARSRPPQSAYQSANAAATTVATAEIRTFTHRKKLRSHRPLETKEWSLSRHV